MRTFLLNGLDLRTSFCYPIYMQTLYLKNMVCNRCMMAVRAIASGLNLPFLAVRLGEIDFTTELNEAQRNTFSAKLQEIGFELIDDRKSRLIEKTKSVLIDLAHHHEGALKENLSDVVAEKIHYEYNYLSSLFSEIEGTTIEKYYIAQKIERVKELLVYDELSLSEISYRLGYSSVAHLSNQFKKVTGLTPSHFKNIRTEKRIPLDRVMKA